MQPHPLVQERKLETLNHALGEHVLNALADETVVEILVNPDGRRDRALARTAFASRLPACVAHRKGKGRLTSHYGRAIASGLGELRPLLLEGRLVSQGLIDAAEVDQLLRPDHLAWRGGYGAIMEMVALELWVRAWEARLTAGR